MSPQNRAGFILRLMEVTLHFNSRLRAPGHSLSQQAGKVEARLLPASTLPLGCRLRWLPVSQKYWQKCSEHIVSHLIIQEH